MERAVFDRMAEHDQVHWWYVARRRILADLIRREADLPDDARILEIGCGTGHNFEMLRSVRPARRARGGRRGPGARQHAGSAARSAMRRCRS